MEEHYRSKLKGAAHAVNLGWAGRSEGHLNDQLFALSHRSSNVTVGAEEPSLSTPSSPFLLRGTLSRGHKGSGLGLERDIRHVSDLSYTHQSATTSTILAVLSEKHYLEDWINSFEDEQVSFDRLAQYCELKLHEAIHVSQKLGTPNAFRTAVASALLCKVCSRFGRYDNILAMLKKEVFVSLYQESDQLFESGGEVRKSLDVRGRSFSCLRANSSLILRSRSRQLVLSSTARLISRRSANS